MTNSTKRDSAYYLRRLEQDGRDDLIQMIKSGDITVYRAAMAAGLRKKRATASRAEQISYHYSRASIIEKRRFISDNWSSVRRIMMDLAERKRAFDEAQIQQIGTKRARQLTPRLLE
jgi:pyruvate carboxylase